MASSAMATQIGYSPKRGQGTDLIEGVLQFRWGRNEQQGMRFNYTDLCPVLVAWVLEETTKLPLATFAERALWQPMGARSDATWLVDAKGFTFSGAGVSATLHDWARLDRSSRRTAPSAAGRSCRVNGSRKARDTPTRTRRRGSTSRAPGVAIATSFGIMQPTGGCFALPATTPRTC